MGVFRVRLRVKRMFLVALTVGGSIPEPRGGGQMICEGRTAL